MNLSPISRIALLHKPKYVRKCREYSSCRFRAKNVMSLVKNNLAQICLCLVVSDTTAEYAILGSNQFGLNEANFDSSFYWFLTKEILINFEIFFLSAYIYVTHIRAYIRATAEQMSKELRVRALPGKEKKKIVTGSGGKPLRRVANLTGKYLDCRIHGIDTSSGEYTYPAYLPYAGRCGGRKAK